MAVSGSCMDVPTGECCSAAESVVPLCVASTGTDCATSSVVRVDSATMYLSSFLTNSRLLWFRVFQRLAHLYPLSRRARAAAASPLTGVSTPTVSGAGGCNPLPPHATVPYGTVLAPPHERLPRPLPGQMQAPPIVAQSRGRAPAPPVRAPASARLARARHRRCRRFRAPAPRLRFATAQGPASAAWPCGSAPVGLQLSFVPVLSLGVLVRLIQHRGPRAPLSGDFLPN